MKNSKLILILLFIAFLGLANTTRFIYKANLQLAKVVQAEDGGEDVNEDGDEGDDSEGDDDEEENLKPSNRNVNVATPVLQGTPRVVSPAPVAVPAVVPALLMAPATPTLPEINVREIIENKIKSHPQLGDTIQKINLKPETLNGLEILQGEATKNEKIFGIFNVQIPSLVEINPKTGEIIKVSQNFWNSFLDFISF